MDKMAKIDLIHKLKWPYRVIRDKLISLRRVLYWLPIIWKDRWWDSSFLLKIIEAKLRHDAKRYGRDGIACGRDRRARQMKVAASLCKRLHEQKYTTPWDKEAQESGRRLWNYITTNKKQMGGMVYYSSEGYERNKPLSECSRWAREREDEMRKQDLNYLCHILQKHLFSWWD